MERLGTTGLSHTPYCKLSDVEIRNVSLETFRDMNLSTYLISFQYTRDTQTWASVKDLLFPGKDTDIPNIARGGTQGWRMVPLYKEFLEKRETGGKEFNQLRTFSRELFDTLKWFPRVTKDKLIDNKIRTTWTQILANGVKYGTTIALNPIFHDLVTVLPDLLPILGPAGVDEEEEREREMQRLHQESVPAVVQAIYGQREDSDSDNGGEMSNRQSRVPTEVVQWAQIRSRKWKGRVIAGTLYQPSTSARQEESSEDE